MPGTNLKIADRKSLGLAFGLSLFAHLVVLLVPDRAILNLSNNNALDIHRPYLSARLTEPNRASDSKSVLQTPKNNTEEEVGVTVPPTHNQANSPPASIAGIYALDEVDVRPWIKNRVMPTYPPPLPPGMTGTTVLNFIVDEQGRVTEVAVAHPAGEPLFDLFAMEAFAKASYTPALKNKKPVKVRMQIAIEFNSP